LNHSREWRAIQSKRRRPFLGTGQCRPAQTREGDNVGSDRDLFGVAFSVAVIGCLSMSVLDVRADAIQQSTVTVIVAIGLMQRPDSGRLGAESVTTVTL